ncbi:hypothetical protein BHE74_00027395 [Ensete ventricosum]|nr:hypothetical protein BHE74_00027395 [Ensete ventricosum]RZS05439.1 hypothetical protein BHM03_00035947 [Ensete ventricosum]
MLLLRFPNSDIRAKVFVRKISFPTVILESFYAFLLCFHSEGSEEGRPATTIPHAGPAAYGQTAAKAPCKGATGCGQGQPAREASDVCKGRRLWEKVSSEGTAACSTARAKVGRLQDARKGLPPAASPAISRGRPVGHRGNNDGGGI